MGLAVVLGGSGHIGAAIARALVEAGHDVAVAGRRPGPPQNLTDVKLRYLRGDDRAQGQLSAWLTGADLVIDAAAPYPVWRHGTNPRRIVAQARKRTAEVLACAQSADAALVHVSSFTTLPAVGGALNRLRLAALRGLHPYFEVKEAIEADVMAALKRGMQGCIINPTACFGPYDLKPAAQAFIPLVARGEVAGSLRQNMNLVDVRDVGACVAALEHQGFPSRRCPIVGIDVTVEALITRIAALVGVAAPTFAAPMLPVMAGAYLAETGAALRGHQSKWPSLPMLLTAASSARPMCDVQRALGVPVTPLDQTLSDAIAWYRQAGYL